MKSDFLTIPAAFNQLGLTAIEKMALALVWGFDKSGNGVFYGSLAYVQEWLGCTKPTAIATLKKLEALKMIKKGTGIFGGEIRRTYVLNAEGLKNLTEVKIFNQGGKNILPNNIVDSKDIDKSISTLSNSKSAKFVKPSVSEVADYCKENGYKVNASAFFDFYESNGWKVGSHAMKDWKAAVRTWEHREKRNPPAPLKSSRPAPHRESAFEHNCKVYDEMFGTHTWEEYYGKKSNNPTDLPDEQ